MIAAETSCEASHRYRGGEILAGKYRLERLLGEGGQACVWQAQNLVLDVGVAIKFVTGGDAAGEQAARLLIEARAAARLRHPSIVQVFDFGRTDAGDSFLVLELLEGESLARTIATSQGLAPERALALLLPIAEAIGLAHAAGIIHRDIKPANIFLAAGDGELQPKLLDFGIAKVESASLLQCELTRAGSIVGSPAYLSPEQARGEADPDHRVDVWAFSATLYQTLTGRLPFPESTYNALLWAIVENEPTPITEYGVGDDALWDIVRRGLSKSRVERWGSMQELGAALASWLIANNVTEDVTGAPLAPRWLGSKQAPAVDAGSPSESSRSRGLPPSKSFDSTSRLHPPLSRSLVASGATQAARRIRVAALAAFGGSALAGALYWLQPKPLLAEAGPGYEPGATNALVKDARAASFGASSVSVLTANVGGPLVVPAEPVRPPTSAAVPANAATSAVPNPSPRRPSAPAALAKPRAAAALPVLAWAPKQVPAAMAPRRDDPSAELLNPY